MGKTTTYWNPEKIAIYAYSIEVNPLKQKNDTTTTNNNINTTNNNKLWNMKVIMI